MHVSQDAFRFVVCLANSLVLEVLYQALHVPELSLQLHLLIAQAIELSAKVGDVGLEHGVDVGARGGLLLQQVPLGLQHLVLLLQEAHLDGGKRRRQGRLDPLWIKVRHCVTL